MSVNVFFLFFLAVVLVSLLAAAFAGRMEPLARSIFDAAGEAVKLAIGLVGAMAFFLGLMRVASDAGLARSVARAAAPVLRRLFPDVPAEHPAMAAMVFNISSNLLGLGNAATPFGVRAMIELDRLNGTKAVATDAMVTFLAVNTAGLAVLPTGILALRAAAGSADPAGIVLATSNGSGFATAAAVAAALLLARLPRYRSTAPKQAASSAAASPEPGAGAEIGFLSFAPRVAPRWAVAAAAAYGVAFGAGLAVWAARSLARAPAGAVAREVISYAVLPALVGGVVLVGWARGVRVYASLVEEAKGGFEVALRILPYLVAVFVAVAMFHSSGAFEAVSAVLSPLTSAIGRAAEVLPVALLRPLSGSGAYGLAAEVIRIHGPDSYPGYLVSVIQGSTETTFYVLAVYLGSAGVRRARQAVPACLAGDLVGIRAGAAAATALFE